jgi:hypothetical protein
MVKHRSNTRWPDGQDVGWHCVRSVSCTRRRVARVSWLSLKTTADGLSVVWPQTNGFRFPVWASKLVATVWWFEPQNLRDGFLVCAQNQAGYDLSVASQNRWEDEDGARYASRSSGLVRVEVSQVRIFQSDLKTVRSVMWMMHVASSCRLHRVQAEDGRVDMTGCVGPFYPNFTIFYVLPLIDILVF